eukprot:2220836-Pyramimonas_sp.AAC.1
MALMRLARPSEQDLAMRAEELLNFTTAVFHGQGLSARQDRSAQQARVLAQGDFDEEACRDFLDDIEPDIKLAASGAPKEEHQEWKEWCAMAVSNGSR